MKKEHIIPLVLLLAIGGGIWYYRRNKKQAPGSAEEAIAGGGGGGEGIGAGLIDSGIPMAEIIGGIPVGPILPTTTIIVPGVNQYPGRNPGRRRPPIAHGTLPPEGGGPPAGGTHHGGPPVSTGGGVGIPAGETHLPTSSTLSQVSVSGGVRRPNLNPTVILNNSLTGRPMDGRSVAGRGRSAVMARRANTPVMIPHLPANQAVSNFMN